MDYIVVDFEWNQSMMGKGSSGNRLPFEIIEIGAVKLDSDCKYVESFDAIIRPKVYRRIHYMTRDLTGITQYEIDHGDPFPDVAADFLNWCGPDCIFCTWGNGDLIELQRNLKYYKLLDLLPGPIRYYNVQKLFRELADEAHRPSCSLETAVELMQIPIREPFHRAIHDAKYTSKVFRMLDMDQVIPLYSVDYYQNPQSREEEIHLTYPNYTKYISREFPSKEKALADREVRSVRCCYCNKKAAVQLDWFSGRNRAHYCLAVCRDHGWLRGKVRFKKTDEDQIFAVKTIRPADEAKVASVRAMKTEMTDKRREQRHAQGHRQDKAE